MKRTTILLVICSACLCYAGMPSPAGDSSNTAPPEGAQLDFTEESYDFGEITQGAVVEHVFQFSNTGSDTLRVHSVRSS